MPFKLSWFILLNFALPLVVYAQPSEIQNPCNDSLFLKLKKIPRASLTVAERRHVEQKEKECAEFTKGKTQPKDANVAEKPEPNVPPKDAAAKERPEPKIELTIQEARKETPTESRKQPDAALNPAPEPKKEESIAERAWQEASPAKPAEKDTTSALAQSEMEPLLTPRNAGIFAAIVAAVVGIAAMLSGVTPSPF